MKVQATYRHTFEVTREVEIDEADFRAWANRRYGEGYDTELAMACWIDAQDTEFHAEVFSEWRTNAPLPSDFEYQGHDVTDVRADVEVGGHDCPCATGYGLACAGCDVAADVEIRRQSNG